MRRTHLFTAWLAIVVLLLDGLLPTAVSAAATAGSGPQLALCSTEPGNTHPGRSQPVAPLHHCAICSICAASALGLLPNREIGLFAPLFASAIHPQIPRSITPATGRFAYNVAQPRAPPQSS